MNQIKSKKNKDRIIVKIVRESTYLHNFNLGYVFNSFFVIAIG